SGVDPQIKAYIDNACQITLTMLLRRMEEMMNCQAKSQRLWNEQMQKVLDEHFSKLEQVSLTANEASTNNRRMTDKTQNTKQRSDPSDDMLTTSDEGRTITR
ncbi:17135_t:CDS:1, partial [Gigaspora margarita]